MKLKINVSKIMNYIFGDSLLKNSVYLMATNCVASSLGFFFWIIAARFYTPKDIGITSAIFSAISLVSMIGSIGLNRALIYYLPRERSADSIINSCFTMNIISSIIFSLIFLSGLRIWSPELVFTLNNLENILIFIIVTIAISNSTLIGSVFTAGRRSSFQMIKETTYHFIKMFPLIFFMNLGAIGILLSMGIGLFLSIIIGYILLFKVWKYTPRLRLDPIIKNMARFSAANYVADVFYNLPRLILPIIILNMLSAKYVGYFYIAMMVSGLLYGVFLSVSNSLLVESSDKNQLWSNINKSIKFNLIILIPGLFLFIMFGKFILNIFNPDYAVNATTTMIIFSFASIPLSIVNIFITVRNAQNRVLSMIKMNFIVTAITIFLSIPLVKMMNIEGAALAYLIANIIGASIVINRIKNPVEFTIKIFKDIKKDFIHI